MYNAAISSHVLKAETMTSIGSYVPNPFSLKGGSERFSFNPTDPHAHASAKAGE